LILDGVNSTVGDPVNFGGEGSSVKGFHRLGLSGFLGTDISEGGDVFGSGPVGEFVVADLVVKSLEALFNDELVHGDPVGETVVVLLNGVVRLGVLSDVVQELEVVLLDGGGTNGEEDRGESFHGILLSIVS
jgi:hypothetical protein